jgi:large subunit ribosomal protein L23
MKPKITEKAVMLIERENVLVFELDKRIPRDEIKKNVEDLFNVKVSKVNTLIKKNKKYAYVKLNKKNPAIDVATKLGLI